MGRWQKIDINYRTHTIINQGIMARVSYLLIADSLPKLIDITIIVNKYTQAID